MSDPVLIAMIGAGASTSVSLGAIILGLVNRRQTKKEVQEIHVMINSRMTDWVKSATEQAYASGVTAGMLQQSNKRKRNKLPMVLKIGKGS